MHDNNTAKSRGTDTPAGRRRRPRRHTGRSVRQQAAGDLFTLPPGLWHADDGSVALLTERLIISPAIHRNTGACFLLARGPDGSIAAISSQDDRGHRLVAAMWGRPVSWARGEVWCDEEAAERAEQQA